MKIFGVDEARYYCSSFTGSTGDAIKSVNDFQKDCLGDKPRILREGTALFSQYRDCSLRDVERSLFLAASLYRRSLDLMMASSSPWAHVTLYYGTWYAARALLGMFGCAVFKRHAVDVDKGAPGQQTLRLRKIGNKQGQLNTTFSGSHRVFWDFFYRAAGDLGPMVEARLSAVLSPISGDPEWQIQRRNEVNYDSMVGVRLAAEFRKVFCEQTFPGSLPGVMGTQFHVLNSLTELVYDFAAKLGVKTDALDTLGTTSPLRQKVRDLIYAVQMPDLVSKTNEAMVT